MLRPGELVGRYMLVKPLGEGGQGSVWEVVDPQSATVRALKLLDLTRLPPSAAARAKLEVEAVMKAADHPAIAPCFDVTSLPDGKLGLVFERVDGKPLADLLRDPRLTARHREAALGHLASALAHIHERGVVHRDLKPENVLVTDEFWRDPRRAGCIKLVDFGIASVMGGGTGLTSVGGFVGTVPYLAPEVISPGRWPLTPSGYPRDVFAFGVLAWELCAGGHPAGLSMDAPAKAFSEVYASAAAGRLPWPPSGVAEPMNSVIAACLALDPRARLGNGAAVHRMLVGSQEQQTESRRGAGSTRAHVEPTDLRDIVDPLGATSAAVPPTRAHVRTPQDRAVSLTTPMPTPTIPDRQPSPAGTSQSATWRRIALTLVAVGLAAVTGYVIADSRSDRGSTSAAPPLPPPSVDGRSTVHPAPSAKPSPPAPCCATTNGTCKSGRTCTPAPCTTSRIPERWLRLRLTGAASGRFGAFTEDLAGTHPYANVCLRRASTGGDWVCAPMRRMAASKDGDREDRLRALTSDLETGNIEIHIVDGTDTLAQATSAPNPGGFKTKTLCDGFRLYVGPKEQASYYVHGYLDDDE